MKSKNFVIGLIMVGFLAMAHGFWLINSNTIGERTVSTDFSISEYVKSLEASDIDDNYEENDFFTSAYDLSGIHIIFLMRNIITNSRRRIRAKLFKLNNNYILNIFS